MKQEPGRQQPGISGLQAGEDVQIDKHDKRLDVSIVAQRLNVSTRTVYRLIDRTELVAIDVGAGTIPRFRVLESSVVAFELKRIVD